MTAIAIRRELLAELEALEVTDRLYHDLKHSIPLVAEVVARLQASVHSGRVLLVAPSALLIAALESRGYSVEVWEPVGGMVAAVQESVVKRRGALDDLLGEASDDVFDAAVLPYVLDGTELRPVQVLRQVHKLLRPGGVLVLASWRSGSLDRRLAAVAGRPQVGAGARESRSVTYAWPHPPSVRCFDEADLRAWSMAAGFRYVDSAAVVDRAAASPIVALGLAAWTGAQIAHGLRRSIPGLRDTSVAVLESLEQPRTDAAGAPFVSVVVALGEGDNPDGLFDSLRKQDYAGGFEVILCGDRRPLSSYAEGLEVRWIDQPGRRLQAAIAAARGEVLAFTDGQSFLPRSWLDVGSGAVSGWFAGAAGPVLPAENSALPFLVLPGARPTLTDDGWFPAANSFYHRDAIVGLGASTTTSGSPVQLAAELDRLGYPVTFLPDLKIWRRFPYLEPGASRRAWLSREYRLARSLPHEFQRWRSLRRALVLGLFASPRTLAFDVAVAGIAAAAVTRQPAFLAAIAAWVYANRHFLGLRKPGSRATALRNLRGLALRHVVWGAGLVHGSLEARRVVL